MGSVVGGGTTHVEDRSPDVPLARLVVFTNYFLVSRNGVPNTSDHYADFRSGALRA